MLRAVRLSTIIALSILFCDLSFCAVITVDADATGNDDGSSWADAYRELQSALAAAMPSDEIRVATGTYKPDYDVNTGTHTGERMATFVLINGVTIKGGYAGFGEPDPNVCDIEAYETILSGDLNGDDDVNFVNNGENSRHVVTGSGTDANAIIDGFTITGGNADGISPEDCGGGMYSFAGSPTVINCTFKENYALSMGGGMFNREGSSPVINKCRFIGNKSDDDGGGIRNYLNCHPTITDCTFIGNIAFEDGGGINNRKNSNAIITDCAFIGNIAASGGGAANRVGRAVATGEAKFINCIFTGNISTEGGGMRNNDPSPIVTNCTFSNNIGSGMRNDPGSNPTVKYCIFWGNTDGSFSGSSTPTVTYSNVEGGFAGAGNINTDPLFVDEANDNYHLKSQAGRWCSNSQCWIQDSVTSPCVDTNDPNSPWTEELWPHGKSINMGAYGGTPEASMSLSDAGNIANLNNDVNDVVNIDDFALFVERWCFEGCLIAEDLNRNGAIDIADFAIFAENWSLNNQ